MVGRFIAGVGALIWNPARDTYLLLKRAPERDYGGGNWECMTGRVDQGESFEQALHREVKEELGVTVKIEFMIGTTHFYRGDPVPENELLGVVYCCMLTDSARPRIGAEHSEMRWVTPQEAESLLGNGNPAHNWLRDVIARAEFTRIRIEPEVRSYHWFNGFDINE
jgi:8-oxo-dGTP diphosphatase